MRLAAICLLWLCATALLAQLSHAAEPFDDFMASASAPMPMTGLGRSLTAVNATPPSPPPPLYHPPPKSGSPIVTFVSIIYGAGTVATFDQNQYLSTVSQEVVAQGGVGAVVSIESITPVFSGTTTSSASRGLAAVQEGVRVQTRITYPIAQSYQASQFAIHLSTPAGQEFLKDEYGATNITVTNVINNYQPPAPPPRPRPSPPRRPPPKSRLPPSPRPPSPKRRPPPPPRKKPPPPRKHPRPPPPPKRRPPPPKVKRPPPPKKVRSPPPKKGRSPPPAEAAALGGIWYVPFTGGWYRWNAARPGNTYTLYKDGSGNYLSIFLGYGGLLGKYPFGRGIFFNRGGAAQVSAQLSKVNKKWVLSVTAGGRRMPANTKWTLGRNVTVEHIKFPGKLWVVITTPEVRLTAKHRVPKKPGQIADPKYGEWLDVYVTVLKQPVPPVQGFLGTTWKPRALPDVASAASMPTAAFEFGDREDALG